LAARYTTLLGGCGLTLPAVAPAAEPVWHLYVVRTPGAAFGLRDALLAHLQARGIGAGVHYPVPLHLQPAYADLGYAPGSLPVTEEVANTCLSLPLYPEMSDAQQDRVVDAVREWMRQQVQA
jgi:dTDP-4-amino-4,6-dideoxygalactose transaminase